MTTKNDSTIIRRPVESDDIDVLMAEDIDAKGDELWEQGAREVLGNKEFERLYPELSKPAIIQCAECGNQVNVGGFTEQELRDDGWLLEPVVYCPVCGPDDEE